MRITIIGPVYPYRGGIAHYNTLLARALAVNHTIQLISFSRQYPSFLYPGVSDQDPSKEILEVHATFILDPLAPWTWIKTVRTVLRFNPDIIVIQWWTTFWGICYSYLANRFRECNKQVIFLVHNVIPHEPKLWDNKLTHLGLSSGNKYIVQTENELKRLLSIFPQAQAEIAPHPIYNMFANQIIPRQEAIHKYNLPENAFILLFFGIVRPYKGLEYLINAVSIMLGRGDNIFLVVAGEFWNDISFYQNQIARLAIQDKVRIDNRYIPNEEIGGYFSAAHIFVAPYIQATQSGAVKLAIGFNLPLVVTDVIAEDNSIHPSNSCRVCASKSSLALAQAIEQMITNYPTKQMEQSGNNSETWQTVIEAITRIE
jgi:glycosyltransferase involved in cell wall biosynthesis